MQPNDMPASSDRPDPRNEILCIGEVLWDALPEGLFLGGALFNVACHLDTLGVDAALVSRVGTDRLGREVLRRMRARALNTDLVQQDPDRPTGFVEVSLDDEGTADYVIVEPAAWDAISWTEPLAARAAASQAVVFGSLAQRSEISRTTIRRLCGAAQGHRVFDVNMRPPHVSREVIDFSLQTATIVKMNDDELDRLRSWYGLPSDVAEAVRSLARKFDLRVCCVTRGSSGAVLWHNGQWTTHVGYEVDVKDTVGAGDAFLAALLDALLSGVDDEGALDRASRLGAYVAARSGAVPVYDVDALVAGGDLTV